MRVVWAVVAVFFAGFWLGGRVAYTQESLDPLVVDPQHYHLEFENEFVKVIRCRIGPHEKVAMHRHPVGSVILFVTDLNLRQAVPDGTTSRSGHCSFLTMVSFQRNSPSSTLDKPREPFRFSFL